MLTKENNTGNNNIYEMASALLNLYLHRLLSEMGIYISVESLIILLMRVYKEEEFRGFVIT